MLSSNLFARRSDYADLVSVPGTDPNEIVSRGGSCIVDPFGTVLAGPDFEGEALLTADIDLDATVRGKFDLDVVGHYARPDVFRLVVNESDVRAVTFGDQPPA